MDYIFLVFFVQGVQCIYTSQWTVVSRHRVDTFSGSWNRSGSNLIECVYMCLRSPGCKAVATKSTTTPRDILCVFRKHGSLQGNDTMFLNHTNDPEPSAEDLLLYEPRHTITTSKNPFSTDIINRVPSSINNNFDELAPEGQAAEGLSPEGQSAEGHPGVQGANGKQFRTVTSNPLDSFSNKKGQGKAEQDLQTSLSGLVVIQQYSRRSRGRALYTLEAETWTFLQHKMDVKGMITKVVLDLKKNAIYRVECGRSSTDCKLKSTSLKTLEDRRLFDLPSRNVDINVQDNGLYMVAEIRTGSILIKTELFFAGKSDTILFTFPRRTNFDQMQSLEVDPVRNKVYWSLLSIRKVLVYMADFNGDSKPVHIALKTRNAYLYPSTELYFADDQGVLSVTDFKRNMRVARCGRHRNTVSTVGRYKGYWYLTCNRKKVTRICIYDGELKPVKELEVKFKGIVASE